VQRETDGTFETVFTPPYADHRFAVRVFGGCDGSEKNRTSPRRRSARPVASEDAEKSVESVIPPLKICRSFGTRSENLSEHQLQSQLDLPGHVRLAADHSKRRRAECRIRSVEDRRIGDVECLSTKLELESFLDLKVLEERKIKVSGPVRSNVPNRPR